MSNKSDMYEFSAPMPYEKKFIDKYVYINSKVKKSKITGVYFAFGATSGLSCGFEQGRTSFLEDKDFEYWKNLIKHSQDNGFKVTYLFNSPKPFSLYRNNLKEQLEKLDTLINRLGELNCTRYRVCNTSLLEYLIEKYPNLEYCASTSLEYTSLGQYINYMDKFSSITEIVPSFDTNRNFKLLKNLRKKYPTLDIELMVNEGCLPGCAFRNYHNLSLPDSCWTKEETSKIYDRNTIYCRNNCSKIYHNNLFEQMFKSNIIYPWNIKEYGKIGIKKFKLVGRNNLEFLNGEYYDYYHIYLKGVDDYKNISKLPFRVLNNSTYNAKENIPFTVEEIINYLPDIKFFIKNGSKCLSECGITCRYCHNCARKFENTLKRGK